MYRIWIAGIEFKGLDISVTFNDERTFAIAKALQEFNIIVRTHTGRNIKAIEFYNNPSLPEDKKEDVK